MNAICLTFELEISANMRSTTNLGSKASCTSKVSCSSKVSCNNTPPLQVLELPSNPYRVAHTWFKLLKPGGVLLTTQPFCERDVRPVTGWPDHYRCGAHPTHVFVLFTLCF